MDNSNTNTTNNQIAVNNSDRDRWASLLASLDMFTDDFLAEPIGQLPLQERETLE